MIMIDAEQYQTGVTAVQSSQNKGDVDGKGKPVNWTIDLWRADQGASTKKIPDSNTRWMGGREGGGK